MPSILLTVFLVQLVIYFINIVEISVLWKLWKQIPSISKSFTEYQELKLEILKLRKDLNATSSQDEFAKWAKLRRHHDKASEKLEKAKSSMDYTKSSFDSNAKIARWLVIMGIRTILQFYFKREPMLYLPNGLVPYYVEWVLSFPLAPLGSVSIQNWAFSCNTIILVVVEVLMGITAIFYDTSLVETKGKDVVQDISNGSGKSIKSL